jgi:hypothetical protein
MRTTRKRCAVCEQKPFVSEKLNVHFCDPRPNPVEFPEGLKLIVCYECVGAARAHGDGDFRWPGPDSRDIIVLRGHHFRPNVSLRNHKLELREVTLDAGGC